MDDDIVTRLRAQCRCDADTCPMCEAADQLEQFPWQARVLSALFERQGGQFHHRCKAGDLITIHTLACQVCGETSSVAVRPFDYHRWKAGDLIQQAFPEMPADQRELLQTGIHPNCWNILFNDDE